MKERPKAKGKRGGCLGQVTVNRFIRAFKQCFGEAVKWRYLQTNPFADVKGGTYINEKRRHYVKEAEMQAAFDCLTDIELRGCLAFARYAGLRIPSDIRDLRFCDLTFYPDGTGIFKVPDSGKTGTRTVPLFEELVPYIELFAGVEEFSQRFGRIKTESISVSVKRIELYYRSD